MADRIASLTTISTLHHGSRTMDLLCRLPRWLHQLAALFVNAFFRMLGDSEPDFYAASRELTTTHMATFNEHNPDAPSVYYQSFASAMRWPFSDVFLFLPNLVVGLIEGENDGLVTPRSAMWTNFGGVLRGATRRGISHADVVDARRMNLTRKPTARGVSDIREFYVEVVSGLKRMSL